MGILDSIFGKLHRKPEVASKGYATMTETNPAFSRWDGELYEQELTRAAIGRFATACSKLKPEYLGKDKRVRRLVQTRPNDYADWPSFLARLATTFEIDDTVFIVPSFERDAKTIKGIYQLVCEYAEIVDYRGEPWVRFYFANGDTTALELKYVGIISKFQYRSEFFGEKNALDNTMSLIDAQNQAQKYAIKNSAKIRFVGQLIGQVREEDMEAKRKRFVDSNLTSDNSGGILLYDQTFSDVNQIQPYNYTIDAKEMERIENNVCTYFGTNMDILQNKYSEDIWGAWYEGRVEPWAIQVGEAITNLFFGTVAQMHDNRITFSSNRLEYASNASKRNMVRDMVDRGIMTLNEGREVLQMPPVEGGDIRVIRGEYINSMQLSSMVIADINSDGRMPMNEGESDFDLGGDDDIYKDSDAHDADDFNSKA